MVIETKSNKDKVIHVVYNNTIDDTRIIPKQHHIMNKCMLLVTSVNLPSWYGWSTLTFLCIRCALFTIHYH